MSGVICKLPSGKYFLWSTVVDAPVTYAMTREQLDAYLEKEEGAAYMREKHDFRMQRVETYGTSYMVAPTSLEDMVEYNRAGPNETCLSVEDVIKLASEDIPAS